LAASGLGQDGAPIAGRYRPEAELGAGGTAQLWRVTDVTTGQKLALKRVHEGAPERLKVLFELESQTLASLRHPRIVEVCEYGHAFYTMKLLAGRDPSEHVPID